MTSPAAQAVPAEHVTLTIKTMQNTKVPVTIALTASVLDLKVVLDEIGKRS